MKKATAFKVLILLLLVCGCLGCVLTLTDYFAPAFSQSEGSAVLNIETYIDGQNQPTHPAVIDMKREWNGYRYWMSYSPYPNADGAEENPCIGVSNDMIHWTTPDGLYNPIAFNEETACDELKDPHIVYNNDLNRMEIWYLGRTDSTIKSGGTLLLFRKVSSDGVHWSEYEIMRDLVGYLSPSIVYSEGKYKLRAIEPTTSGREGALAYSESTDGDTWTPFEKCTFGGYYGIEKIWHGAVSLDDTYRFAFIEDSGKSNTILYTESHDGITWESPVPIVRKENFWKAFYRPCILYSDSRLYCIYGVITQDNEWYLSMSMGDSVDNLHGISTQDIGNSKVNMTISEKHTLSNLTKNVYHFVQSICRPELLLICAAVAILLLIVRKCSFILLWGGSWLLGVLRFYSQMRGIPLSEKFWLLFSVGAISAVCSLAIQQVINWLDVRRERAR